MHQMLKEKSNTGTYYGLKTLIFFVCVLNLSVFKILYFIVGNQGNLWNFAKLLLRSNKNYQLVIEARRGDGFLGDISVDDISFTSGCVPDYKATLSPNPITPSPPPGCKAGEFR